MNNYYIAIDIGGTKILLALFDDQGQILYREKVPTPVKPLPQDVVSLISSVFKRAKEKTGVMQKNASFSPGVCFAGFVEQEKGIIRQAPNLYWNAPVALGLLLQEELNTPVLIENDANAAVVGEVFYGSARGHRNVIYITLSTGIGGGFFLDGRLYRGSVGFAGEVGHTKPFGAFRKCNCSGISCLEAWASGSGIIKSAEEIWDPLDINQSVITTMSVFDEAENGNQTAKLIVGQAMDYIGTGLSNLVTLLNPSCLVLGGGLVAKRPYLIKFIESDIREKAIRSSVCPTELKIVPAALDGDSGIWGIYALLKRESVS